MHKHTPYCPHVYDLGEQDEGATDCIFSPQNCPHFKISPNASSRQVLGCSVRGGLEGAAHSSFSDCLATRAAEPFLSARQVCGWHV